MLSPYFNHPKTSAESGLFSFELRCSAPNAARGRAEGADVPPVGARREFRRRREGRTSRIAQVIGHVQPLREVAGSVPRDPDQVPFGTPDFVPSEGRLWIRDGAGWRQACGLAKAELQST